MKIAELVAGERHPFVGDGMEVILNQTEAARLDAKLERVRAEFETLVSGRPEYQLDLPLLRRDLDFFLPVSVGEHAVKGFDEPREVLIWPSRTSQSRQQASRTDLILGAYTMTGYPRCPQFLGAGEIITGLRFLKANQHEVDEFAELLDEVVNIVQP